MDNVKVTLLRPLDGRAVGETAEYPAADAKRLAELGAVSIGSSKGASVPSNKMAPSPANKSARSSSKQRSR